MRTRSSDIVAQLALEGLKQQLDEMVPRVQQVMKQARACVFRGNTRAEGKILSVFEPSTEVIRKGKFPIAPPKAPNANARTRSFRASSTWGMWMGKPSPSTTFPRAVMASGFRASLLNVCVSSRAGRR
jgi:hypothetical protein